MSGVRTLRRGEAVALSSLSRSRRSPDEVVVSVHGVGGPPDVVALLLGVDGRVRSDRDLVFFNQPTSAGGAVSVDPSSAVARIRTGAVEEQVARVLVGCAGGALDAGRASTLQVDIAYPGGGVLATAVIEVPAGHRAETVLEVYRWGGGWRLRVLGEGYTNGLDGLVRDHGVQVEAPDPVPAAVGWAPPAPPAPPPRPPQPEAKPTRKRRTGVLVGAGGAIVLTVVLGATFAGGSDPDPVAAVTPAAAVSTSAPAPSSTPTPSATPLAAATAPIVPVAAAAQAQLALLPVKGRAPMTGYDRAQFGQAWADVDRNGCDTRNDILRRDVSAAVIDPATRGCVVVSGTVADPYSGADIPFTRGANTSADVQIDHVVALGDAWQTGAQQLDASRREQFANDPANLLAVDGSLNQQKGAGDAATWLPPNKAFRCTYVTMQVTVKSTYGLWVTAAERDAIARVLATCPGATTPPTPTVTAPSTSVAPPSIPATTAPVVPPPADGGGSVYYDNCDAVRAAGKAPLYRGDPGYRSGLDRDDDGIACEP